MRSNNIAINEMASELIDTKKENRKLQEEIELLRQRISDISFDKQSLTEA